MLTGFFDNFSVVHDDLASIFCAAASPSIKYSIFRKNISRKIVWGQTQPQNKRPNAAVNKMMKTMNVIIVIPKIKKSCGQNTLPKIMKLRPWLH
jgi:hypothetical protein